MPNTSSLERLNKLVRFDETTGRLFWRIANSRRVHVGEEIGNVKYLGPYGNPYWAMKIDGTFFRRARLVYFMTHGQWPIQADHINGDSLDDRPENLRSATSQQNNFNRKRNSLRKHNLPKGVSIAAEIINAGMIWKRFFAFIQPLKPSAARQVAGIMSVGATLVRAGDRNTGGMNLRKARLGKQSATLVSAISRRHIASSGNRREVKNIAVSARRQDHRICGMRTDLTCDQVANDHAFGMPVDQD